MYIKRRVSVLDFYKKPMPIIKHLPEEPFLLRRWIEWVVGKDRFRYGKLKLNQCVFYSRDPYAYLECIYRVAYGRRGGAWEFGPGKEYKTLAQIDKLMLNLQAEGYV